MESPTPPAGLPDFNEQYAPLVKDVFREHVAREQLDAAGLAEQARAYAERGKPEFVLAYLMAAELPSDEKREMLARAFERRAEIAEAKAQAMDTEYKRPFPLIGMEARKDRTMARQIRQGKMIKPYARASKPLSTL